MFIVSRVLRQISSNDLVSSLTTFKSKALCNGVPTDLVRIGVCVSGGPDSMALACLLNNLDHADIPFKIEPFGFIVDHNARPGSGVEAKRVSRELERLGIDSSVYSVTWPQNTKPLLLPDFELQARKARYRIIVQAALEKGINHLFVGHHQDDQIETLLSRMIRNLDPSFLALQGIKDSSPVPCCEDIFGARHEFGHVDFGSLSTSEQGLKLLNLPDNSTTRKPLVNNLSGLINVLRPGGIQVYRPLLNFPKSALIEFCETNSIQYVKDKTNFDPTLTRRNTIRNLRANYHLPGALQDDPILDLCYRSRERLFDIQQRSKAMTRYLKISSFDFRSGTIIIEVAESIRNSDRTDPLALSCLISNLTKLISPESAEKLTTFAPKQTVIEFSKMLNHPVRPSENASSAGIHVNRVTFEPIIASSSSNSNSTFWRLSRQPMRAQEIRKASEGFSLTWVEPGINGKPRHFSNYILWDCRYWIRVRVLEPDSFTSLQVRPYKPSDVSFLDEKLSRSKRNELDRLLKDAARGKVRYTLPVLTYNDKVVAFPTLSTHLLFDRNFLEYSASDTSTPWLEWDIYYKAIEDAFIHQIIP